ncbi:NfeD family protein [Desulfohalovibrio reitneri]|uniref:NfeD family protein n=1 Tax=Desulfohalovibrio reitneri TaxID=1307759 RepID=UPI0004A779D0|nr:nodulation protein NfeD [Desulfohalovibrio reitneri]
MVGKLSLAALLAGLLLLAAGTAVSQPDGKAGGEPFEVVSVRIEGGISPAQDGLLGQAIAAAAEREADMVLVELDTPGGTAKAMRDMVQRILGSPVPVAVWVGPSGSRAASAGVFLVAASSLAAMAPQTTIGAASPVPVGGGEMDETMARKVKNDILSFVRGVAESRGRNVEWYEKAVEEAVSITAEEAAMLKVIDMVADSPRDLLEQAAAKGVPFGGEMLRFDPESVRIIPLEPSFRYKALAWLLDPQIAYFLLLGGMAGLFFELSSPGAIFPGVLGGFCLLLALYALSILPTSAAGLALLVFGLVLFLLEVHVTSYGLLSVAGVAALLVGSIILFPEGSGGTPRLPLSTIAVTVGGLAVLLGLAVFLAAKAHMAAPSGGLEAMVGELGVVRFWREGAGQVSVRGELWSATTDSGQALEPGAVVEVAEASGLKLVVRPATNHKENLT